ncbi:MAG TPA: TonB-dependent receptor [Terriglobia bacterium]|nr:TonB-dependent receptor [Terriglobia bacterium]
MSKFLAVLATLLVLSCSAFAGGEPKSSTIQGITREPAGKPLAHAQVVLHSVAGNIDRTVISGDDGAFTVEDLSPGRYQLMASKDGFRDSSATAVDLGTQQSLRVDVTLGLAASNGSRASSETAANAPLTEREKQLLDRLSRLEERLAAMEAKESKGSATQTASISSGPNGSASEDSKTTPATGPMVASLSPAAGLPSAKPLPPSPPPAPVAPPKPAAPPAPALQEALQAPEATTGVDNFTPFAYADFTWMNGTSRNKDTVLDTKFFTPEVRFDTHYMEDFNQPHDHTMGGATESFRSGEVQVEQVSVGGDFHWQNVRGRVLYMDGLFATTTPRNDASAGVGQWDVRGAYKYVSEAWGGYHFNVNHGLNVDAGIFVSYIGLFSYYNFDNWVYQPSFVSSNTPWFFNGVRIQWFPTNKLKIEPWIINGWQSYNKYNGHMGYGGQILYRPYEWLSFVFNNYGNGQDNLGLPNVVRIHTDDSVEMRYYNRPLKDKGIDKMAFSFTGDLGCQYGGGYRCFGGATKDAFLGWMAYNRLWWGKDKYALTMGGGMMNNPGRYLTLLPPINGADAVSGSPYFTENPGQPSHMWDSSIGIQWMPREYITWWAETVYRHSDVPYWTGRGGITPPGGNNGLPQYYVCNNDASTMSADPTISQNFCTAQNSTLWNPDLRHGQATFSLGVMVKF